MTKMMKTIPLTKGYVAMVDDEDYDFLMQWKWHASVDKSGLVYAKRVDTSNGDRKKISMHRLLIRTPECRQTDHVDHNGLNNQKGNLRVSTPLQNGGNQKMKSTNTSGFKGVTLHAPGRWKAQIRQDGRNKYIGIFNDPVIAAWAYDLSAIHIWGEFAATNLSLGTING